MAAAKEARQYPGAWGQGMGVVSTVLPFELNISPYIFTRITSWIAGVVRKKIGIYTAVCVDDLSLGAETKEELRQEIKKVKEPFQFLGVMISEKTCQEPREEVEYLESVWSAREKVLRISQTRGKEYKRRVTNLLRYPQSKKVWQRLIGKHLFIREAVGPTLRHLRAMLWLIERRPRMVEEHIVSAGDIQIKKRSRFGSYDDRRVKQRDRRYRGHVGRSADSKKRFQHKMTFKPTDETHINLKELEALEKVIVARKNQLRGRTMLWYTDNMTAGAVVRGQGSQNIGPELWKLAKRILDLSLANDINLIPRHVPERWNLLADQLSRKGETFPQREKAPARVTSKLGPCNQEPFAICGGTSQVFEEGKWMEGEQFCLLQ